MPLNGLTTPHICQFSHIGSIVDYHFKFSLARTDTLIMYAFCFSVFLR